MKSNLINDIISKYYKNFNQERITFVLPSKRSIIYANHSLGQCKNIINIIYPEFVTPNQLIENITNLIVPSKIDLIHLLYISYKENYPNPESYASFVNWGSMLLNDFNDITTYYPDDEEKQKAMFTNLKEIKEIEHWSLNREPLSDNQKKYLDLMYHFYDIFTHYNNALIKKGIAYSGLNYQQAVHIIKHEADLNPYLQKNNHFVFIGLNAITPAEKIIYEYLIDKGQAEFYWDYDTYYLEDDHEAGKFLRQNFKEFGPLPSTDKSEFDKEKHIHILSASNDIEEALYIKKILSSLPKEDIEKTAIILHKPEYLNLILSAIPKDIQYNVSMEYPLYLTPVYQFVIDVLKIHIQIFRDSIRDSKNKSTHSHPTRIYHKNLIKLLQNPFVKYYLYKIDEVEETIIQKFINDIIKQNKIFVDINEVELVNKNKEKALFISELFNCSNEPQKIVSTINELLNKFLEKLLQENENTKNNLSWHKEILNQFIQLMNRIEDIISQDAKTHQIFVVSEHTTEDDKYNKLLNVYTLMRQVLMQESVPFKGEPLQGLQVIGLLESRLLDFDNIIIPFMNEGIFPPDHHKPSFFSYYDLRTYFKLPTYHDDDAIFSYLFYRAIQYPKNIYLSYNNAPKSNNTQWELNVREKSRYIQHILYELSTKKKNIKVTEYVINYNNQPSLSSYRISIPKTHSDKIWKALKEFHFSPTSISTYLKCSLQFYFKYILNLEEKDTTDEIKADIEGNIFHAIMSRLYRKYIDDNQTNIIKANKLDELKKEIEEKEFVKTNVEKELKDKNLEQIGKNFIIKEIIIDNIKQLIEKEFEVLKKEDDKVKIIYVEPEQNKNISNEENTLNTQNALIKTKSNKDNELQDNQSNNKCTKCLPINIKLDDESFEIHLISKPDRIDYLIDKKLYRVIDYKSSIRNNLNFDDFVKLFNNKNDDDENKDKLLQDDKDKLLQLLIYIHYITHKPDIDIELKEDEKITGCIIPLKNNINDSKPEDIYIGIQKEFKKQEIQNEIENIIIENIMKNRIFNKKEPFQQTTQQETCNYCSFTDICNIQIKDY